MQAVLTKTEIQKYLQAFTAPTRYSARKMTKPVNFYCVAPDASQVFLTGDFNDWNPVAHPLTRQPDGTWLIQISLNHGHQHYQFLVDGKPTLDPRAHGIARNHRDERVSLVAVS
jgi:1,4-alpha-glucan branching enzyme